MNLGQHKQILEHGLPLPLLTTKKIIQR